jgi:hypothetical protein
MPGVAQVWLTADELHALVKVSTTKGATLSPRMEAAIMPKLEEARNAVGCPVPFARKDEQLPGQVTVEEAIAEAEKDWPPAEPVYGGF